MKLICERDALSVVLGHVASRARNKLKIPILQHVLLDATAHNRLSVTGTDLATRCVSHCPAEVAAAGSITVSADHLARLIDGLPQGGQVKLEQRGTDLHIECGKSRYKLPTMPAADFPEPSESEYETEFSLRATDVKRLFGEPAPALPANDSRMYLFGVYLCQREPGFITVTATDGLRFVRLSIKNAEAKLGRGYIVPKPTLPELVKLAALGDLTIRLNEGMIEVEAGNVVFTSKLIDGTYPDLDKMIPGTSSPFILVDRAEFVAAFKRLTALEAENSTLNMRWKVGEGAVELSLSGDGSGSETVACECNVPDGEIAFQPRILGAMLDVMGGDVVQLHVTGATTPMRLFNPADEGLTVIAMPCKGRD